MSRAAFGQVYREPAGGSHLCAVLQMVGEVGAQSGTLAAPSSSAEIEFNDPMDVTTPPQYDTAAWRSGNHAIITAEHDGHLVLWGLRTEMSCELSGDTPFALRQIFLWCNEDLIDDAEEFLSVADISGDDIEMNPEGDVIIPIAARVMATDDDVWGEASYNSSGDTGDGCALQDSILQAFCMGPLP